MHPAVSLRCLLEDASSVASWAEGGVSPASRTQPFGPAWPGLLPGDRGGSDQKPCTAQQTLDLFGQAGLLGCCRNPRPCRTVLASPP